jgi:hypothetical protein
MANPKLTPRPYGVLPRAKADNYAWIPFGGGVRRCLRRTRDADVLREFVRADLSAPDPTPEAVRLQNATLAPVRALASAWIGGCADRAFPSLPAFLKHTVSVLEKNQQIQHRQHMFCNQK